jgi:hypothetical protein
MSVKEQIVQGLDTLSKAELIEVAAFLAFLKFRARFQPMPKFDEAQLSTVYQADAEEDQTLAEAGMAEYMYGLCQEKEPG